MRICVFGASGFIGRHLASFLASQGHDVRTASRTAFQPLEGQSISHYNLDISTSSVQDLGRFLDKAHVVYYLASSIGPSTKFEDFSSSLQEDLGNLSKTLEAAITAQCTKFIYTSSGGTIYGDDPKAPSAENHVYQGKSPYSAAKAACENLLLTCFRAEKLQPTILRIANPFGPGQRLRNGQGVVPAILEAYYEGSIFNKFNDGIARRDYIYIGDLIEAMASCLDNTNIHGEIINVGSGVPVSLNELISTIEEILSDKLKIYNVKGRPTDVLDSFLNIEKARSLLKWYPKTDFKSGLEKTLFEYDVYKNSDVSHKELDRS